ncbi:MAG TPA: hypothetical protein PLT91_00060 [Clostridia bacterium]|jgi:hypothetical protein|nr:MAG: hypothetical protein BWX97_00139 [Firmicutes bacterium ADurb.Bin146]HOD92390.1 hypothetical protein [Clostridia bacterium]HQM38613.1 hypothetical protein [Clostridia bacterium]
MSVQIEKVPYGGWDNCYRIFNDEIELIVTSDVGPRVIRYGFIGRQNVMCEKQDQMGKTGGDEWRIYGGHRLWHSPEHEIRSYFPDNTKVDIEIIPNGIKVSQPVETTTMVKKDIKITISEKGTNVYLKHIITNHNLWDIELAAWALTVVAPGGLEVVPQETLDTKLLPNRMISLWPYSDMNDKRVQWGSKYIFLQHDSSAVKPFKFGISNTNGWAAYFNHNYMFIKKFSPQENMLYPDYSASMYETYTCDFMTEMESLSPLTILGPKEKLEHDEQWQLIDNLNLPKDEKEMDRIVKKYIVK